MSNFKSLQIYLTEEEWNQLIELSEKAGISRSKFGKQIVVDYLINNTAYSPKAPAYSQDVFLVGKIEALQQRMERLENQIGKQNTSQLQQEEIQTLTLEEKTKEDSEQEKEITPLKKDSLEEENKKRIIEEKEQKIREIFQKKDDLKSSSEEEKYSEEEEEEENGLRTVLDKDRINELIKQVQRETMGEYLIVSSCDKQRMYWTGGKSQCGTPCIENATRYKSTKSAKNMARKIKKSTGIYYETISVLTEFINCPDSKKEAVFSAWEIDK